MDLLLSLHKWHSILAGEYSGLDSEQASAGRKKEDEEEVFFPDTLYQTPACFSFSFLLPSRF